MNSGQLYILSFFNLILFSSLEDLKRAPFTNYADGGYKDIMTPNGPPGLYGKLQTERLSKELKSTVTDIPGDTPFLFIDKLVENDKTYYNVIAKGRIGWFKTNYPHKIIPLNTDTKVKYV